MLPESLRISPVFLVSVKSVAIVHDVSTSRDGVSTNSSVTVSQSRGPKRSNITNSPYLI